MLLVVYWLLFADRCLLFVACCLFVAFVGWWLVVPFCRVWFVVVCCSLYGLRCSLFVVCWLLFIVG